MKWIKKHFLLLVLVTAAIVRLGYVLTLEDRWYFFDTTHYDTAARSLLDNGTFGPSLHFYNDYEYFCLEPSYPIFLAGVYALFGRSFLAVRVVQILLSLLQIWFAYQIGLMVYRKAAKLIAGVTAFYPFFIYLSGLLYVTQLVALLIVMTVFAFLKYRERPTWGRLLLSGLLLGVSMVTLPVLTPTVLLFVLWLLFLPNLQVRERVLHSTVLILLCIAVMAPWTLRNYNVFGKLSLGRACLAETKVLNYMHYLFEREKALEDQVFEGQRFAVEISGDEDSTRFTYFIDDTPFMQLSPRQALSNPHIGYTGLMFYGGDSLTLDRMIAGRAAENQRQPKIRSDRSQIAIQSSNVMRRDSEIFVKPSDAFWSDKLLFAPKDTLDYFVLDYGDSPHPNDVRRVAILFGLDSTTTTANGYMTWLHPWKEPDLWRVQQGQPSASIPVQKTYLSGASPSLFSLITEYPGPYVFKHFIPEFLNFWSPWVHRITTDSNEPGTVQQWLSFLSFAPLLLFMPIGMVILFRHRPWQLALFLIFILTISGGYSLFFTEVRYRLPIDNLVIILAMIGLCWTFNKMRCCCDR